jgi:hypothetical protein
VVEGERPDTTNDVDVGVDPVTDEGVATTTVAPTQFVRLDEVE